MPEPETYQTEVFLTLCGNFYEKIGKITFSNTKYERILKSTPLAKKEKLEHYNQRVLQEIDFYPIDNSLPVKK